MQKFKKKIPIVLGGVCKQLAAIEALALLHSATEPYRHGSVGLEWESGSAGSVCARRIFPLKDFPRTTTLMKTTDLNGMEATPESPNRLAATAIYYAPPVGVGSRAHEKPPIILYTRGAFSPDW